LAPTSSDFAPEVENICVYLHFPKRLLRELFFKRTQQNDPRLAEADSDDNFAFPFTMARDRAVTATDSQIDRFVASMKIPVPELQVFLHQSLGIGADIRTQARHLMQVLQLEDYLALHDLGYRPSDLLQTNSIIWVEGPSDRIYLQKWISIAEPSLKEGIDYSIMFYGGRLLAHLSASEETIDEFIELLRLNRFSSIVIDSDKRTEQSQINETKQRLVREIEGNKGVAWVTSGREIENEIQRNIFEAACAELNRLSAADLDDKYSDRLVRADDPTKQIDKIRLARAAAAIAESVPNSAIEPIRKLIAFIKSATLKSV
jgi:hypothetical protein